MSFSVFTALLTTIAVGFAVGDDAACDTADCDDSMLLSLRASVRRHEDSGSDNVAREYCNPHPPNGEPPQICKNGATCPDCGTEACLCPWRPVGLMETEREYCNPHPPNGEPPQICKNGAACPDCGTEACLCPWRPMGLLETEREYCNPHPPNGEPPQICKNG